MRIHPRYSQLQITDDGQVIGPSGRILKWVYQFHGGHGRPMVTVYDSSFGRWGRKRIQVSVLVCETFHGPRPPGMHAAHEDGDMWNNHPSNLAWKTAVENEADKIRHGTKMLGERHHRARLDEEDIREIRRLCETGVRQVDVAQAFGVRQPAVSAIFTRRRWKHVA